MLILSVIICCVSLIIFIIKGHSAYEWPALDTSHYIERHMYPNIAKNDFLYSSAVENNPKYIYPKLIISFSKIFNTNWYNILYFIKLFLVFFLPISYFTFIYSFFHKKLNSPIIFFLISTLIFLFTIWIVIYPDALTIGWWNCIFIQATPYSISILLCFVSFSILNFATKGFKVISLIFYLGGFLIHPPISIMCFCLNYLCQNQKIKIFEFINYLIIVFFMSALFMFFFKNNFALSAFEFNYHYSIIAHPFHYILKYFQEPNWKFTCIVINSFFLAVFLLFYNKNKKIALKSFTFLIIYSGTLLVQFIITEIYPIKFLIIIGPIRFLMFSPILIFVIILEIIVHFSKKPKVSSVNQINLFYIMENLNKGSIKYFNKYILILSIFLLFFVSYVKLIDDPLKIQNDSIHSWIIKESGPNDVFLTYNLATDINLKSKRAVFVGNGFPFNERYFNEYSERLTSVFGSYDEVKNINGNWLGTKHNKFFHSKSPQYFLNLSKKFKINYIVFENDFLNNDFKKITPVYRDNKFSIYNLELI